jgi:hypothetical protein
MKEEAHRMSPINIPYRLQNFVVFAGVSLHKTPAVCPCDGQARPFPFLYGSVETKEVPYPIPTRKLGLTIGPVKIDDENLVLNNKEVFKLEIIMVKT